MKNLKLYEEFQEDKFEEGDMVYVDPRGPATLAYSSGAGEVRSDKPFKPKVYGEFEPETQYEIVSFDKGM